jgi:hypothetical protein
MPSHRFQAGDLCFLDAEICNAGEAPLEGFPLFVVLEYHGSFWFAPSWRSLDEGIDYYLLDHPVGRTVLRIIEPFVWPADVGEAEGLVFWGALTTPDLGGIVGQMGSWTFGWR